MSGTTDHLKDSSRIFLGPESLGFLRNFKQALATGGDEDGDGVRG